MDTVVEIGRLLHASVNEFVFGCRVTELEKPSFGALVYVPVDAEYQIYGLIYNIRIEDDGLVRQLVMADNVDENIIADNRLNRIVPLEINVLTIGYLANGQIFHFLPPRPPLSLDLIYLCNSQELRRFTNARRFGYFRHVLRAEDLPVGELLAAHLAQAKEVHNDAGDLDWAERATQELITLLRDDYSTLMSVLGAVSDSGFLT